MDRSHSTVVQTQNKGQAQSDTRLLPQNGIRYRLSQGQFILQVRNWSNFHQIQAGSGSVSTTHEKLIQFSSSTGWIWVFILHARNWSNFHQVQDGSESVYTTHGKLIQFSNSVNLETAVPASSLLLLHDSLPVKDKPNTSGCIVEFIQIQDYWEQVF